MKRVFASLAAAGLLAVMALAPAAAVEKSKEAAQARMQEMMEQYAQLAVPGEHHAHLAKMEGTWTADLKSWVEPGAPPIPGKGKAEMKMILGGRYLQMDYSGDFMGKPFSGMGLFGYDNGARKHIDVWVDTLGTFMLFSEGQCSEGGRKLKTSSEYLDPTTGQTARMESVLTRVSEKKMVFEMLLAAPTGGMFKTMEITYTR